MISITTTTVRTYSIVIFRRGYKVNSTIRDGQARISKSKTLDGAVVIVHNGFVEGDRSLDINGKLTRTEVTALWNIFSTQTFVNIAIDDGVFDGVISRLKVDSGQIQMQIEMKEKLSA